MSLVRIALRIAATEALKGTTLVGDRVLDSQIAALEADADGNVKTDEEKPFIAVYTDAAQAGSEGTKDYWLVENGETDIIFEFGITAAMTEINPATEEATIIGIGIPATDQAFELTLDLTARQIMDTLADQENEWATIFRGLYYHVVRVERGRAASESKGVRLAGQQIRLTVHAMDDPIKGQGPNDPDYTLVPFLEALEASSNADYVTLATHMRAAL